MASLNWIQPNVIIAIGSLLVAIISLTVSFYVSRRTFSQSASFKAADLDREDILQIRNVAASFLTAHARRLLVENDIKNMSENLKSIEAGLAFNSSFPQEKLTLISEITNLRKIHQESFSQQVTAYENMSLLVDGDPQWQEMNSIMVRLMNAEKLIDINPGLFTKKVKDVLQLREKAVRLSIGVQA
jgi:hypothetical protein